MEGRDTIELLEHWCNIYIFCFLLTKDGLQGLGLIVAFGQSSSPATHVAHYYLLLCVTGTSDGSAEAIIRVILTTATI